VAYIPLGYQKKKKFVGSSWIALSGVFSSQIRQQPLALALAAEWLVALQQLQRGGELYIYI
jgi:hypothetical protein